MKNLEREIISILQNSRWPPQRAKWSAKYYGSVKVEESWHFLYSQSNKCYQDTGIDGRQFLSQLPTIFQRFKYFNFEALFSVK